MAVQPNRAFFYSRLQNTAGIPVVLASRSGCRTGDRMGCKLGNVIDAIEEIVPSEYAEDWDNSGMQLGGRDWQIEKIWVALDPLPEVISAACEKDVNLVITHHPTDL